MTESYFVMRILSMIRFVGVELNKDQEDYLRRHLDDLKEEAEKHENDFYYKKLLSSDLDEISRHGYCCHCGGAIAIRNPTGFCDHLYYPEECEVCKKMNMR